VQRAENGSRGNLIVGLLWLNFVALWARVYTFTTIDVVRESVSYIGHFGLAYAFLVTLWILHNIRIFRKKGPRLIPRLVAFSGTHDSLNQPIFEAPGARQDQEIVVKVVRGQKFFLTTSGAPNDPPLLKTMGS
jgi:hypothetical protein